MLTKAVTLAARPRPGWQIWVFGTEKENTGYREEQGGGELTDTHGLGMGKDWKMSPTMQYW